MKKRLQEAVKYLATGNALPYTGADGSPDHRLMGAAWAALHGGFRGNKYAGKDKDAALAKLAKVYKAEKMDTPQESWTARGVSIMYEADGSTPKSGSFDALRCRAQSALQHAIDSGEDMDLDGDNDRYSYAWIADMFPTTLVYSMDSNLFQCEYHDNGTTTVLGTPWPVEQSYTKLTAVPAEDANEESYRLLATEISQLNESYDASTGSITMTVIKPGFNKSKGRFYPAEVLKSDYKIFENAKMFADHQTESEQRTRPEGSVRDWVGQISSVWAESDGTIKGKAAIIDPAFKSKLELLSKQNLLGDMGISIRAIGEASNGEIDGVTTKIVESLVASRSVDFVTYAGAGGRVEAIESAAEVDENDVDLITEAQLRLRRPDLVEMIEVHSVTQGEKMKTLEQQLSEAQGELATSAQKLKDANEKIAESEKAAKKSVAAAELTKLLSESKTLPKLAKDRLTKQFAEALTTDGMKEAIASEEDYVKSLGGTTTKHNGEADNVSESDKTENKKKIVEGFKILGLSEAEAAIAGNFN